VDQLIYIFECRLGLRDENSSLNTKTLIGSSLRNRLREFKVTSRNSKTKTTRFWVVFVLEFGWAPGGILTKVKQCGDILLEEFHE
jgi:hypothetical protein